MKLCWVVNECISRSIDLLFFNQLQFCRIELIKFKINWITKQNDSLNVPISLFYYNFIPRAAAYTERIWFVRQGGTVELRIVSYFILKDTAFMVVW